MIINRGASRLSLTTALAVCMASANFGADQIGPALPEESAPAESNLRTLSVREVSIGRIPEDMSTSSIPREPKNPAYWQAVRRTTDEWLARVAISPNQMRLAIVEKRDGEAFVTVNGLEGPRYDEIVGKPSFSPDSQRLAYSAVRGESQFMVVDGVEGKSFEPWIGMYPIFSPDGNRVAYLARRGSSTVVVIDRFESRQYAKVRADTPPAIVFSPDSKRFAYCAELEAGGWAVTVNGVEGRRFEYAFMPQFSPDSRHVAYVALRGREQFVIVDGVEGPSYKHIPFASVEFSPDGRRIAYQAQLTNGLFVLVVDGTESKPYEHIESSRSYFSPDSRHVVFAAKTARKTYVVVDNVESPTYDGLAEMPLFSADSKQLAYAAALGWSEFIVLNETTGKKYGRVYRPTFSPDSKHLAFAAVRRLSAFVVRDGKEGPRHWLGQVEGSLMEIVFSPDSRRLAYYVTTANKAKQVVVDEAAGESYERIHHGSLVFSPDSKHVAYWAAPLVGRWRIYVDGEPTEAYDRPFPLSWLEFDGANVLHALAERNDEIFRLEIDISDAR